MTYHEYLLPIYCACFTLIGIVVVAKRSKWFRWVAPVAILLIVGLKPLETYYIDRLLILFFLLTLVGIVFFSIQGIVFIHKHLGDKWRALWIVHAVLLIIILLPIYWAVYPRDRFYIDEFNTRAGYQLPDEVKVIKKYASYPDFHGDYYSQAIIVLEKPDYEELVSRLVPNFAGSGCLDRAPESHRGVTYYPTGCYSKQIESDAYISVTYFEKQNAVYYYFSQT